MKKNCFIVVLFFLLSSGILKAEDNKTREINIDAGYKFYSVNNSSSPVNEYSGSLSSPALQFNMKDYSESNKYRIKLNLNEEDDYDFDIFWYYKDKLRLELQGVYFDHDTEFKENPTFVNLNDNQDYITKYRNQHAELKYKPSVYPFHIRFKGEKMEREGNYQKRFYGPASLNNAYNSNDNIYSRKAPINYVYDNVLISLDGLLGGINVTLEVGKSNADDKAKITDDGVFKTPEIDQKGYAIKATTNQSGKISVSFFLSGHKKNNQSVDDIGQKSAESTYNKSAMFFSYNPTHDLKLSVKATYEDYEQQNPFQWSYNNTNYLVPPAVSYTKKTAVFKANYLFNKATHIVAEVRGKEMSRDNVSANIPENSNQIFAKVGINSNIKDNLSLQLSQSAEKNKNAVYKDAPEVLYKTNAILSYSISENLGADFNAEYSYAANNDVENYFVESKIKNVYVNVFYTPDSNLALNLYGMAESHKSKSDLVIGEPVSPLDPDASKKFFVMRTPYNAKTFQIGINCNKTLSKRQTLYTDIFYLRSYGTYEPPFLTDTIGSYSYNTAGLNSLANVDFYQYGLLIGTKYKIGKFDTVKCELGYKDHQERAATSLDGTVKTLFVAWERKW